MNECVTESSHSPGVMENWGKKCLQKNYKSSTYKNERKKTCDICFVVSFFVDMGHS